MANLSLVFDLMARDNASRAFRDVGDAAEHAGKKGEGFGSSISGAMKMAGGALLGAGIVEGFKSFYDAAAESAKVSALTEAAIKSTGGAAKLSADQVGDLVTAISNKTGVDDEAIQSGANLLLTFTNIKNEAGKGNDIFTQTTQIMTDMSAALGTDASGSAIQLGKALNDPVKGISALSKVGVSFTAQQKDQVKAMVDAGDTMGAQKLILKELSKEFGGAAAAASTPLDKLKVNLGNVQEAMGAKLIPIVNKASDLFMTRLLPAFDKVGGIAKQAFDILFHGDFKGGPLSEDSGMVDKLFKLRDGFIKFGESVKNFVNSDTFQRWVGIAKDAAGTFWDALKGLGGFLTGTLAPALSDVGGWLSKYSGWLLPIAGAVAGVTAAWGIYSVTMSVVGGITKTYTAIQAALNAVMSMNPIGLVVLALAALVGGFIVAYKNSETFRNVVSGAWDAVKAAFSAAWDGMKAGFNWLKDNWPLLLAILTGPIGIAVLLITKNWDKITGAFRTGRDAVVGFAQNVWDWVVDRFNGLKDGVESVLKTAVNNWVGHFTWLRDTAVSIAQRVWDWVTDKFNGMKDAVESVFKTAVNNWINHFTWLRDTAVSIAQNVWDWVSDKFTRLKDAVGTVLKTAVDNWVSHFTWLRDTAVAIAQNVWDWVVDRFNGLKDGVVNIFTTIRDTVGKVWDGLVDKVKAPIRIVFTWVNDHMIHPVNDLLGHFPGGLHVGDLPTGFAAGGYTGDGGKYEPKGVVHGGEYVFTKEETAKAGVGNLANLAKSLRGYVDGGPVGFLGSIGHAIGGAVGGAVDWGKDILAKGAHAVAATVLNPLASAAKNLIGDDVIGGVLKGAIDKLVDGVLGKSTEADKAQAAAFTGTAAGGVQRWLPLVLQSLAMTGQPASLAQTVLRRMNQESGGNPMAINNWDINARNGVPSKGLMQVIDPTFRANAMPGYASNIYDPLSNLLASERYAIRRYGSLAAAYNKAGGYEKGTNYVPETGPYILHKGEAVVPAAANSGWKAGDLTVHVQIGDETIEAKTVRVIDSKLGDLADNLHYAGA